MFSAFYFISCSIFYSILYYSMFSLLFDIFYSASLYFSLLFSFFFGFTMFSKVVNSAKTYFFKWCKTLSNRFKVDKLYFWAPSQSHVCSSIEYVIPTDQTRAPGLASDDYLDIALIGCLITMNYDPRERFCRRRGQKKDDMNYYRPLKFGLTVVVYRNGVEHSVLGSKLCNDYRFSPLDMTYRCWRCTTSNIILMFDYRNIFNISHW